VKVVVMAISRSIGQRSLENSWKLLISAESIDDGVSWIENVLNFCDEKQGTPFQKCEKAFRKSILRCRCDILLLSRDFLELMSFQRGAWWSKCLLRLGLPHKNVLLHFQSFRRYL
jgi:hypothetical protein